MRLTVVRKIILSFALFGCLLLLTSILSYFGLSDIRQSAVTVVERIMPAQSQMVEVKTEILQLATITANGYHETGLEGLNESQSAFARLAGDFLQEIQQLDLTASDSEVNGKTRKASEEYVAASKAMYEAIRNRLLVEQRIQQMLEKVLGTADEASALMLDLSYLDPDSPGVDTLIGAGTAIDNKLLTLNTAIAELVATNDPAVTQNIMSDLEYQLSNLQVDREYINRLAQGTDDGGTVAMFNEQYDRLIQQLNGEQGLIALQEEKLAAINDSNTQQREAIAALNVAIDGINAIFDKVNQASLAGQRTILETVQNNLVKNLIVSVVGLLAAIVLGILATRSIANPLAQINRGLSQLSRGNLSKKLDDSGKDEFSDLAAKVNNLTDSLRTLVGSILEQEQQLIAVTKESVDMGERSLRDVDEQREQVSTTSAHTQNVQNTSRSNLQQIQVAMQELTTVTEQSQYIASLVATNREQVNNQATQAQRSAEVIHRLDQNSRNIGTILDVIKNIAEQTNLLALNAAIEAARAGDQGRGFAVVADEVRTLATRTHNSTEEIEAMIGSVQKDAAEAVAAINVGREQAQEGVKLTAQVSEQVEGIRGIIAKLGSINHQIVNDTQQQDALLASVAESLTTIVELAESSARSTRLANESTLRLDAQMDSLRKAVERFTL